MEISGVPPDSNTNNIDPPIEPMGPWRKLRNFLLANPWHERIALIALGCLILAGTTVGLHMVSHRHKPPGGQPQKGAAAQSQPTDTTGSDGQSATSDKQSKKKSKNSTSNATANNTGPSSSSSNESSGKTTPSGTSGGSSSGSKAGSGGSSGGGTAPATKLAVPTYWWTPATYDTQLDDAGGSKVGFAIANIDSGPGSSTESNFQTAIDNERAAGIKVYGYVYTNYGARSLSDVETDIDGWYSFYNLDGILFDEAPGTGWSGADKTYYQTLYNYVKAKTGSKVHGKTVVLNPGTITDEYAMSVSDIVSDYEDVESNYAGVSFSSWTKNYPASRFWNIMYDSAGVSHMQADISLAKSRNVGYVYVTTDSGANPYDTLPSNPFWTDELNAL